MRCEIVTDEYDGSCFLGRQGAESGRSLSRIYHEFGIYYQTLGRTAAAALCTVYVIKGKGHPCTGTEALYRPYGP